MESGFVTRPIESGANKYAEWLSESSGDFCWASKYTCSMERAIHSVNKQAYPPPTVQGSYWLPK